MSFNLPQKRPRPFADPSETMDSNRTKRARPNANIQALSLTDRQVLERAAALLNKTVSQLLDVPVEEPHQAGPARVSTAPFAQKSRAQASVSPNAGNAQAWYSAPPSSAQDELSFNQYNPSVGQSWRGIATDADNVDLGSWQRVDITPNGNTEVVEIQQAGWPIYSGLSSAAIGPMAGEGVPGVIELSGGDSDESSETSDIDIGHVEAPDWESNQINSVASIPVPADPSGSETFWFTDAEGFQSIARAGTYQLVPGGAGSKAVGPKHPKSRRPFQDESLRIETSNTRKLKACVRCRMQKIRCIIDENDPTGICKTCQGVSNQRLYTLPCARYKITECTLYRTGKAPGLEFTFRWPVMKLKDISKWDDNEIRRIKIQSDVCLVPFELNARRFTPLPQDSRKRGWMDGKVKKFKETTPFGIVNMSAALKDMKEYIDNNVLECMNYFLRGADTLVKETYDFAIKHTERHRDDEEGLLMGNYLRLWFAIRRTHTTEHIVSRDTLDMDPETVDRSFPLFGKVPLPPVMIQQLDMILTIGVLQPLRKKVLEDLQKLILSNKPSTWMTVYLITFMSLHNCATISNENYRNARKHGLKRRYAMPAFVAERHHAANVFLSHYHYRTQPCDPFKLDWRKRQTTPFAEMTPNEIQFLMRTKKLVEERRDRFRTDLEIALYEDELYFISQMFEEDWQPKESIIDFDDGTINSVPLQEYE